MKFLICFILLFGVASIKSQSIPSESTKAVVTNKLGFGNVQVEYTRPNVNSREIWDGLVRYGQVWRTGADYPTFISFEDIVSVENEIILPGKYALYTIPGEIEWVVILSRNTKLWGAFGYNKKDDALRIKVVPEDGDHEESFLIYFSNTKSNSCDLVLHWEKVKLRINISVDIKDKVLENLNKKISSGEAKWGDYWKGARFLYTNKNEKSLAIEWIERSVTFEENWMNMDTYAKILHWNNEYDKAIENM